MKELLTAISFLKEPSNELLENLSKFFDKLIDEYDLSVDIALNMSDILMRAGVIKATINAIIELYKKDNNG